MKRKYIDVKRLQSWQESISFLENISIDENIYTEITYDVEGKIVSEELTRDFLELQFLNRKRTELIKKFMEYKTNEK